MFKHPALTPPLLTAALPGVGGRIKVQLEDFEVEEIPAYDPSGEGDHLFLWIEKRGIGPEFFARTIAQRLAISVGSVGTAGLKDRYSVSRQWVSVPTHAEANLGKLDSDDLKLLKTSRHNNKLKPGHSRGNRFKILIRDADATKQAELEKIVALIRAQGLPNYYGPQRFGRDGDTVTLGLSCLAGTQKKRLRPFVYKFALSAVQSLLFNDYLGRRLTEGLFRKVLQGEAMMKWPFGGIFNVEDLPVEQARFDARETVTAGPMFGKRTFAVTGPALERELEVLRANDLRADSFNNFGKLMSGTRRHNQIYLEDLVANWEPTGLRLSFSLPAGSYATVLLAEVMKPITDAQEETEEANEDDE